MKINELISAYNTDMQIRNLSKQTITNYINSLKLFSKYLEDMNITEIEEVNGSIIKQYIYFLKNSGKKPTYINTTIKKLKAFYSYLNLDFEVDNVMSKIKQLATEKSVVKTFDLEYAKVISKPTGNNYLSIGNDTIITLLLETGIRVGELVNIKIEDISLQNILIHGKGAKQRQVPISKALRRRLNKYLSVRNTFLENKNVDNDYLLLSSRLQQISLITVEKMIKKRCGKMNLPYYSAHKYRHFFTRQLLINGIDVYTVSKILGHESVEITQQYLNGLNIEKMFPKVLSSTPLSQ